MTGDKMLPWLFHSHISTPSCTVDVLIYRMYWLRSLAIIHPSNIHTFILSQSNLMIPCQIYSHPNIPYDNPSKPIVKLAHSEIIGHILWLQMQWCLAFPGHQHICIWRIHGPSLPQWNMPTVCARSVLTNQNKCRFIFTCHVIDQHVKD